VEIEHHFAPRQKLIFLLPGRKLWMDSGVTGRDIFPYGGAKLMGPAYLFSRMPLQSMVKAKNSSCLSSEAS
jgi:hypothetical protein